MEGERVKLFGYWASPFALRVKWALKIKGVEYQYIEENLREKSSELLQYNPVHKKVPVLVHNGRAVAESLVIIEYIDETWTRDPLLPEEPYERAKARFWAKFADEKCVPTIMKAFSTVGEERQNAVHEAQQNLKTLESGLEGKRFFGGNTIGFVDIAVGWIGRWAQMVGEIIGSTLIDDKTMPRLSAWFDDVLETPLIKGCMPPQDELLEHNKAFHKVLTAKYN